MADKHESGMILEPAGLEVRPSAMNRQRRTDGRETVLVCTLLFILLSLLFWRMVWWQWILFDGDMWTQYYPAKWYSFMLIRQGEFPLWTPNLFFGFPLFAEAQAGLLYPFSVLFLFLPAVNAFNVSILLRLILAGLFTFLYVRRITGQPWAAAISGVTFACGGYMIAQLRHENVENALIWLPLILFALDRWITEDDRRALAGAGICMGVSFLAGYFYISLFVLITAVAYYIFMDYFTRKASSYTVDLKRRIGGLALFGLIGVGLAGVQILPNYELAQESIRSGGIGYETSTQVSVPPFQMICLIFPKFFGYPVDGTVWGLWTGNPIDQVVYMGIVPLMLAVGALMIRRDTYTLFFGIVCGGALLLSFGQFSPLWYVVNKLPVFSMMRNPARFLSLAAFSGAVLAGLGFTAIMQASVSDLLRVQRYRRIVIVGASLIVSGGLISGWAVSGLRSGIVAVGRWFVDRFVYARSIHEKPLAHYYDMIDRYYDQLAEIARISHPYIYGPVLFMVAGAALIWYITRRRFNLMTAAMICLALTGCDLVLFGRQYNVIMPPEVYEQRPYYFEQVMDQDPNIFRYCFAPLAISMRNYDALLFDQMYIQGQSPLRMKHQTDIIEALRPQVEHLRTASSLPLLNLLNIKYIVTEDSLTQDWAYLRFNEGARVYENRAVLPRAFVVPEAQVLSSPEETLARMAAPDFAPLDVVFLEEEPQMSAPAVQDSSQGRATIVRYDIHEVVIDVESGGGFLVLTDTFYPGWRAEVNGVDQPILRGDYMFRAVPVSPGRHRVRFVYEPFSFTLGIVVSLLAFGVALGVYASQRKADP